MSVASALQPAVRGRAGLRTGGPVVVTGMGLVSAAGSSISALQQTLRQRQHCLRPITAFDATGMTSKLAGEVADFDPLVASPLLHARTLDRGTQMALDAARQALAQAALDSTELEATGVAVGVSGSVQYENMQVPVDGHFVLTLRSALYAARSTPSFQADALARAYKLGGPRFAFGSASLGGLLALSHAMDLLHSGHAPAMLVGGGEIHALINALGMDALGVAASGACTPFAGTGAGGICFGEGAAFFVLEMAEAAAERGARVLGELVATGISADAYGELAQDPSGSGLARAIRTCLADAELAASQIGWVRTCGTGHRMLDGAEAMALRTAFDGACPPVTSTEPYFGHVNGVSPLLGLAAVLAAQDAGLAPGMPEPTDLRAGLGLTALPPGPLSGADCLLTATAFGGTNGALVVRRPQARLRREPAAAPDANADDVVIAGIGAVSTFGPHAHTLLQALSLPPQPPGPSGVHVVDETLLPARAGGINLRGRGLVNRMATVAVAEALADAGMDTRQPADIGLLVGLTRGPMSAFERFFEHTLQGRFDLNTGRTMLRTGRFSVASGLAQDFGLRAYSGALACGVHGGVQLLAHGAQVLRGRPELQGLLVVAAEEWTPMLGAIYARLGLLAEPADAPGCAGGEGAAALLLLRRRRGEHAPRDWARIEGTGLAGDTGAQPDPQGHRYGRAVAAALVRADRRAEQVQLVIGQACGWPAHEARERAALNKVMAGATAVSVLAHTGLVESTGGLYSAIAAAAALRDGRLPYGAARHCGAGPDAAAHARVQSAVLMGSSERGAHAAVVLGTLQA